MKRRGCDPAIKTNTAVPRGQEAALAAVNALSKTQGGTTEDEGRCADRFWTLEVMGILCFLKRLTPADWTNAESRMVILSVCLAWRQPAHQRQNEPNLKWNIGNPVAPVVTQ